MAFKTAQVRESSAPSRPSAPPPLNPEIEELAEKLSKLRPGNVLRIQVESDDLPKEIRRVKGLATRAGRALGKKIEHWDVDDQIFVRFKPDAPRRRGRPPSKPA